jgi:hypothetical protein
MSWFFFSYARINTNPYLRRFYADLWKGLSAELTAEEQRHKSFADWERLELMSRWSRSLQEALEWSRVLVCMTSRAYVTQEWCGKELAFFERLSQHHNGPQAQRVLPVIWGKTELPEILSQYQMVQGIMPDAYFDLGLARMMSAGNMWPAYRRCVDALGQAILDKGRRIEPRGGIPGRTLAAETSAFIVPNRFRTRVVYCFTGGRDWRPFLPPPDKDESADELVATVIARRQIGLEEIPLTAALADTVLNAGDDPVLILVDPRAAQAPEGLAHFEALDRNTHKNTALFVTWNEQDPSLSQYRPELERRVNEFLLPRVAIAYPPVRSPGELQQGINATLEKFEQFVINRGAIGRPVTGELIRVSGTPSPSRS